jgi:hypothetical protein
MNCNHYSIVPFSLYGKISGIFSKYFGVDFKIHLGFIRLDSIDVANKLLEVPTNNQF